ncbi:MAG: FlgD immunoglobulin-like domain containing protein [Spirochaetia bacterium]
MTIDGVTLEADITGAGNLSVNEADDIELTDINTANGDVTVTAGTDVTVGLVSAAGSTVTITASAGSIDDDADDGVNDITADTMDLTANAGGIGQTNGNLDVTAGSSFSADTTADGGNIAVRGIGDLPVGLVDAGTGDVVLISTGAIYDNVNDGVNDINADTITLTAVNGGIGQTNGTLDVTAAAGGRIDTVTTADGGSVSLESSADIPVGSMNAGAGNVTLITAGAVEDHAVDAVNDVTAGAFNVTAVTGIGSTGELETDVGTLDLLNNDTGDIVISENDDVTVTRMRQDAGASVPGTVSLTAGGDITLVDIFTLNSTVTAVVLTSSTGSINGSGGAQEVLSGNRAVLRAATGIGDTDSLNTNISSLDAENSTSGDIVIDEAGGLSIFRAVNSGGAADEIRITDIGGGDLTVDAAGTGISTADGDITLENQDGALLVEDTVSAGGTGGADLSTTAGTGTSITVDAAVTGGDGGVTINAVTFIDINAPVTGGAAGADLDAGTSLTIDDVVTGGAGGVSSDAAAGNNIDVNADINSSGGPVTISTADQVLLSADITTGDGSVTFSIPLTLDGNAAIDTVDGGAGGAVTFADTINGTQNLTLTAGTGDVDFQGLIGGTTPLAGLSVTGNNVDFVGIGNGGAGVNGTVSVNGSGRINLNGPDYITGDSQSYIAGSAGTHLNVSDGGSLDAGAGSFTFRDIYVILPVPATITLYSDITCRHFRFFEGTLNLNGNAVSTTAYGGGDFAVFGGGYDPDDPDRDSGVTDEFEYPDMGSLPGWVTALAALPYSASFTDGSTFDLSDSTVTVGGNFYVNGTDLRGGAAGADDPWSLAVQDSSSADYLADPAYPWGEPYAAALNLTVDYSNGSGGYIGAAEPDGGAGLENNRVTDGGGNNGNWDFIAPYIDLAETVYDNVIKITFNEPVENSANQISSIIASVTTDSGTVPFTGSFTNAACTSSTDGAGDLTVIYLQTTNTTWNTDAVGTSIGDDTAPGISTNRSDEHRNVLPTLSMLKGLFADASAKNLSRNYGTAAPHPVVAEYTGTVDSCRPVLLAVETGRDTHDSSADKPYDAHNYWQLRYSESVTPGDAGTDAENLRADTAFSSAAEHGGHAVQNGTAVDVVGYFSYPGTFTSGSKDGNDGVNSLYRTAAANDYGSHGIRIFAAGYSGMSGGVRVWPGYITASELPSGTITVPANTYLVDDAGNAVEPTSDPYPKPDVVIENAPVDEYDWDTDFPAVADFKPEGSESPYHEILTNDISRNFIIDRFDFNILDNSSYNEVWDSYAMHPWAETNEGVRDSSINPLGFKFEEVSVEPVELDNPQVLTRVENALFYPPDGLAIDIENDTYFSLAFDEREEWSVTTDMWATYDSAVGGITDLAGNLLASFSEPYLAIERTPPEVNIAIGIVGSRRIYVNFSKPVVTTGFQEITSDLFVYQGDNSFTSIEILEKDTDGVGTLEAFLYLENPLTIEAAVNDHFYPLEEMVFDELGNPMLQTVTHPITDIGIGVAEPVWAIDSIHREFEDGGVGGTLTVFDGTGGLMDQNILIRTEVYHQGNLPLNLIYDVNPPEDSMRKDLWLPETVPGYLPEANLEARTLTPVRMSEGYQDFIMPATDEEIVPGETVEFLLRYGDLYCATVSDPEDPRTVRPWLIPIRDITRQRGGVTILNNLINPELGEKTALNYSLESAGRVKITVFTGEGNVVDVIYSGIQGKGNYTMYWDGRNAGDRIVARGIYFIRIVAPGIDEFRKVMIVK